MIGGAKKHRAKGWMTPLTSQPAPFFQAIKSDDSEF